MKNALTDQNLLCHWTLYGDLTSSETNNLSQHWNYMHVVGNSLSFFFFCSQKDLITCHYSKSSWNLCRPLLCNLKSPLLFTIVGFGSYKKMQNDGCACIDYHPNSASSEVHRKPAAASHGSECRLCIIAVTLIQIYLLDTWNSAWLLQLCCEWYSINWLPEKGWAPSYSHAPAFLERVLRHHGGFLPLPHVLSPSDHLWGSSEASRLCDGYAARWQLLILMLCVTSLLHVWLLIPLFILWPLCRFRSSVTPSSLCCPLLLLGLLS